jgi:hypothetical protein
MSFQPPSMIAYISPLFGYSSRPMGCLSAMTGRFTQPPPAAAALWPGGPAKSGRRLCPWASLGTRSPDRSSSVGITSMSSTGSAMRLPFGMRPAPTG